MDRIPVITGIHLSRAGVGLGDRHHIATAEGEEVERIKVRVIHMEVPGGKDFSRGQAERFRLVTQVHHQCVGGARPAIDHHVGVARGIVEGDGVVVPAAEQADHATERGPGQAQLVIPKTARDGQVLDVFDVHRDATELHHQTVHANDVGARRAREGQGVTGRLSPAIDVDFRSRTRHEIDQDLVVVRATPDVHRVWESGDRRVHGDLVEAAEGDDIDPPNIDISGDGVAVEGDRRDAHDHEVVPRRAREFDAVFAASTVDVGDTADQRGRAEQEFVRVGSSDKVFDQRVIEPAEGAALRSVNPPGIVGVWPDQRILALAASERLHVEVGGVQVHRHTRRPRRVINHIRAVAAVNHPAD